MPKLTTAVSVDRSQLYKGYHWGWGGQVARVAPVADPDSDQIVDGIALDRILHSLEPETDAGACVELDLPYSDEPRGGSGMTAVRVSVGDIKTVWDAARDRLGVAPVFGFLNSRRLKGHGDVFIREGFSTIRGVACQFRPRTREDHADFHGRVEKAIAVTRHMRFKPLIIRETFSPRVTLVWPMSEPFSVEDGDGTLDAAFSAHIDASKLLDGDLAPDVLGCTIALPGVGYTLEGKREFFSEVQYPDEEAYIENSKVGLDGLTNNLRNLSAASR